jgi:hypothetical protein
MKQLEISRRLNNNEMASSISARNWKRKLRVVKHYKLSSKYQLSALLDNDNCALCFKYDNCTECPLLKVESGLRCFHKGATYYNISQACTQKDLENAIIALIEKLLKASEIEKFETLMHGRINYGKESIKLSYGGLEFLQPLLTDVSDQSLQDYAIKNYNKWATIVNEWYEYTDNPYILHPELIVIFYLLDHDAYRLHETLCENMPEHWIYDIFHWWGRSALDYTCD